MRLDLILAKLSVVNGIYPPFKGQPVQGFSAALKNEDGSYMAMSDNGLVHKTIQRIIYVFIK
jgi:hypothetical protein